MEDKESGSLSQRSPLDLIVELYRDSITGSLKFDRAPLQKAIFFREGQILFAASNDPKDQLASILVEEGKLGPDQMQVAQGRVSSGNPLAKVLTELGYISQRELADAARIKVEKILTDVYTWSEGTYQFVTKSPKVAIADLGLSSRQLIYASICRIQDRDWVLAKLDSLEVVLAANEDIETLIRETQAVGPAADVLRSVDGVKTVKQIGALSSLGEFDVCKILAAGIVVGALTKSGVESGTAVPSDEAFSLSTEPEPEPTPQVTAPPPELPFGAETVGLEVPPAPPVESSPSDTVFQPADNSAFESPAVEPPAPQELEAEPADSFASVATGLGASIDLDAGDETELDHSGFGEEPGGFGTDSGLHESSADLLLDESDDRGFDDDGSSVLTAPRPKRMRGGRGSSLDFGALAKLAAVAVLAVGAAYGVYTFVWPMVGGGSASPPQASSTSPTSPPPQANAPTAAASQGAPTTEPPTTSAAAPQQAPPSAPRPTPAPDPPPSPAPSAPAPTSPRPSAAPARPTPAPAPPPSTGGSSGAGRQLLASGNLRGAASAFQNELSPNAANKFTVAVGLYCSEDNANRVLANASGSTRIYVLPASVNGRSCYRIIWGMFDSRQAAESAMTSLPPGVRAGDAAALPLARALR